MTTTVLRFEKIKSTASLRGSGDHVQRYKDTPNADPTKFHLNRQIRGSRSTVSDHAAFLSKHELKPRKNSVLAIDAMFSLSPDVFKTKGENLEQFVRGVEEWLDENFGSRCINAVLHLDETTPHIHACIVPAITKFNKVQNKRINSLSARELFGADQLSQYQKSFFAKMNELIPDQLIPPRHGEKAKHQTIRQFYYKLNQDAEKLKTELLNEMRLVEKLRIEAHENEMKLATQSVVQKYKAVALKLAKGIFDLNKAEFKKRVDDSQLPELEEMLEKLQLNEKSFQEELGFEVIDLEETEAVYKQQSTFAEAVAEVQREKANAEARELERKKELRKAASRDLRLD